MRVLAQLQSVKRSQYDLKYYHKLQSFIYSLLKDTEYEDLHDRGGYKFFSFSNIFPPHDIGKGELRYFLFASPDSELVKTFKSELMRRGEVQVGEMVFKLKDLSLLKPEVEEGDTLITGTPIVMRIPREQYEKYSINPSKNYDYIYWKKKHPFRLFKEKIIGNLQRKYKIFYESPPKASSGLFQQFKFKKQVCNHVVLHNQEIKVIGTLWRFKIRNLPPIRKKLLEFGLEAGFGHLNSLGFGFINIKE